MKNSSSSVLDFYYIEFDMEYDDYGRLRYVFFTLCLLVFVIIICGNVLIVSIICLEKSLHQPMYFFICCLCFNAIFGSSSFLPRFLMDLLSDTHFISRPLCFLQMYMTFSYTCHELPLLCIMAYDRFIAICHPLHYNSKMTVKTVACLITFAEVYPLVAVAVCVLMLVGLPLCRNKLQRLYCSKLGALTCADTTANQRAIQFVTMATVFIPMFLILYTYLRILAVCMRSSAKLKGKVFRTCLPQIMTFVNFSLSLFCDLLITSLRLSELHPAVTVVLTLEKLTIAPLSNPLIYGFNLPQIRGLIFRRIKINMTFFFFCKRKKSNV